MKEQGGPTMSTPTLLRPAEKTATTAGAEMTTIHTAFRRELRLAPDLIRSVEPGDRLRAGMVGVHLDLMDRFLHHHHTVEDELLWPRLLERVPAEIAPIVELMEAQHHVVADLLERTAPLRASWRRSTDPTDAGRLAAVYTRLHTALVEHMDAEQEHVMPLVEACITQKEWAALGKAAQRGTPLKDAPRILGMMAYDGDPGVIEEMLGAVPAPMRGIVLKTGRRAYAKHAMRVYGTPTP
jgi:hemerythrin-like domain-containing protein